MIRYEVCEGRADELFEALLCLDELSKDTRGELLELSGLLEECPDLDCVTLTTEHALWFDVTSNGCDSELGRLLDGRFTVRNLTTVFTGGHGEARGMHTGDFTWSRSAPTTVLRGKVSGMTNVGTHREPAFQPGAQACDERGVLEGRLCGRVVRTADPRLAGAQVFAVYRVRFDPTRGGGAGAATGVFEGVVVRQCKDPSRCVEFPVVGSGSNPRSEGGLQFEISDLNGPVASSDVVSWAGHTGLHVWHSTRVTLPGPVGTVELTLVHFAQPATATAFDANGIQVATAAMTAPQQVPETLVLSAPGIAAVVVESPQDEVLLVRLCRDR